jgi:TonB family protein
MDSRVSRESRLRHRTKRLARATLFVAGGGLGAACGSSPPAPAASPLDKSPAQFCLEGPPKREGVVQFDESRMGRPTLLSNRAPILTESIRSQGLQGLVVSRCIIKTDSTLEDCCILKSGGELDQTVIEAVRTWRYEPVAIDGKPVKAFYVIQVKIVQQ